MNKSYINPNFLRRFSGTQKSRSNRSPIVRLCLCSLLLSLQACAAKVPANVTVVEDFELDRYLGRWYEIARLDHRFERGMSAVTAEYKPRDKGGIEVLNRGYVAKKEKWKDAKGKAFFVKDSNRGQLKVSFFGPFYGGYNIMSLDQSAPDYRWSLVAGPNTKYLWILSRTPELPKEQYDALVAMAAEAGFPVDELIIVDQTLNKE
jgi:apolipoprotein D and lipocalin family protein